MKIPGETIGGFPARGAVTAEGKVRAQALFDECKPSTPLDDETIDEFFERRVDRLRAFRTFVEQYDLPKTADFLTWHRLYDQKWEQVDGAYLSAEEIAEFAKGRD